MICLISWVLAIPMFFVPEPERNATNKQELMQKVQMELVDENFDHLSPNNDSTPSKVSLKSCFFSSFALSSDCLNGAYLWVVDGRSSLR